MWDQAQTPKVIWTDLLNVHTESSQTPKLKSSVQCSEEKARPECSPGKTPNE